MAARANLIDDLYRTLDEVPPDAMMPDIRAALAKAIDAIDVVLLLADCAEVTGVKTSTTPSTATG